MILDIVKLSVIFTLIDSVFLYSMSGKFQKMIKNIQGSELKMSLIPTILCYIFLIFSLYYFIVSKKESITSAFLLGLSIYGVFETTNLAIFKKWDPVIGLIDTLWGGVLFSLTYYIYILYNGK
jgi:uncharacterized membrane protein